MDQTFSPAPDTLPDARQRIRDLTAYCNRFKGGDVRRSILQLTTTLGLFAAVFAAMLACWHGGLGWATALLTLPAAGLLVRVFIIQHDCGHLAFFRSRRANDWTGRALSVLTFTPYGFWRQAHNIHHSSHGNLDRRGIGGIDTLTVREYKALPRRQRISYRIYRQPLLLIGLGTPFYVLLMQRFPLVQSIPFMAEYRSVPKEQAAPSVYGLNLALALFYGAAAWMLGWTAVLLMLPVVALTAIMGGWLFYIQHQFEDTHWSSENDWNFQEAALLGSSYYALPKVLQWFSGNIGMHHIHHLNAMIPNYRLQECLDGSPDLQTMNRMSLRDSLKCLSWALWDEDKRRMVSFRELARG